MANQMRGLLRVVNDLEAGTRVDREINQLPSAGGAQAFAGIAGGFADIGAKIGALADHAAAKEGTQAGREAGLDPEFRPTRDMTIRGEAYDRAGFETYGARVRTEFAVDLDEAFEKHKGDPGELAKILDGKKQAWLGRVLPELRPDIETGFQRARLGYMRQASREQAARITAEQAATQQTELGQALKAVHQQAFQLGLDPTADDVLAGRIGELSRTLGRKGVNGKPLIAPEAAAKLLETAKTQVTTARVLGAFDRLPSVEEKERFLAKFEEDFANSRGAAKQYDLGGFREVSGLLRAELSRDGVQRRAALAQVRGAVDTFARDAREGIALADADLAQLKAAVTTSGDADLTDRFNKGLGVLAFARELNASPTVAIERYIAEESARLRRDGAKLGDAEVDRLQLAEQRLAKMHGELARDPLGWAAKTGLMTVPPLDASNGEALGQSLKARAGAVKEAARFYGREETWFRGEEAEAVTQLARAGGQELAGIAAGIVRHLGEDAPRALGQILKDAPEAAFIGRMMLDDASPRAIRDAADGVALRRMENFQPLISNNTDLKQAVSETVGTTFAALPRTFSAALKTAASIYEVRALRDNIRVFDRALYLDILSETMGEVEDRGVKYGGIARSGAGWVTSGNPVLVPPGVRSDSFDQLVGALQEEDLALIGGDLGRLGGPRRADGTPFTVRDIKAATGRFQTVGSGQYAIAVTELSDPAPQYMVADDPSRPFVLDLNRVMPVLRRRRPDLFLGGREPVSLPIGTP